MTVRARTAHLVAALAIAMMACGDDRTPGGGDGAPLDPPAVGTVSRVDAEPAGDHCADGGAALRTGRDRDGDGALDDDEIESTRYVCGGDVWRGDFGHDQWASPAAVRTLRQCAVVDGQLTIDRDGALELPRLQVVTGTIRVTGRLTALSMPALETVGDRVEVHDGGVDVLSMPLLRSIDGTLAMTGPRPYRELDLPSLRRVGTLLVEFDGMEGTLSLPALERVRETFQFRGDVLDLPSLTTIGQRLVVAGGLKNLDGLPHLVGVDDLWIGAVPAMTRLGLPALERAGSVDFMNSWPPVLVDLALPRLIEVARDLRLTHAAALATIDLSSLSQIGGDLELSDLPRLQALRLDAPHMGIDRASHTLTVQHTGLIDLELHVHMPDTGVVVIADNPALTRLTLDGIQGEIYADSAPVLRITGNPSLTSVAIAGTEGADLHVIGSPQLEHLDLPALQASAGFELRDVGLRDLSGLPVLHWVDAMALSGTPRLTSLASLAGLEQVSELEISRMDARFRLTGLERLTALHALTIADNVGIPDLAGLGGVVRVTGPVSIHGNQGLALSGLDQLTEVAGDLQIADNERLPDLIGLDHLARVGGALRVSGNPALASVHGLEALAGVGGDVAVNADDELTELTGLRGVRSIGGGLTLAGLPALAHVGTDALVYVGGALRVSKTGLPTEEIAALRKQLGRP